MCDYNAQLTLFDDTLGFMFFEGGKKVEVYVHPLRFIVDLYVIEIALSKTSSDGLFPKSFRNDAPSLDIQHVLQIPSPDADLHVLHAASPI